MLMTAFVREFFLWHKNDYDKPMGLFCGNIFHTSSTHEIFSWRGCPTFFDPKICWLALAWPADLEHFQHNCAHMANF
jgi:hypothetical protein